MSSMECEQECLRNCSCSAYANVENGEKERGCLIWYWELINMVDIVDGEADVYVRVDAVELAENMRSNGFHEMKWMLTILVVSVLSTWFFIIIFAYLWLRRRKKRTRNNRNRKLSDSISGLVSYKDTLTANELQASRFFNTSTILTAANNSPANRIGQGGFGSVYKLISRRRHDFLGSAD
ncbi:G-type lectin S-receptor-like serine/threonine-protein kinase At1g11410 isoform X2 [Ricinus communis]|uniref:G-type lectin S-receptor-like serine/threonine-protein kinase At1g11410 isoform X2 n=1 Tax=Ricinus communis TaxID=3988 RepID=UPI00201ADF8D|nr:G-type lectin S-receptor-like serine/threonine-protein kinase At1g11410 isoform X2 [Ricinus communis]